VWDLAEKYYQGRTPSNKGNARTCMLDVLLGVITML
jgi:hypothetical protein